jgi:hypothetical protein
LGRGVGLGVLSIREEVTLEPRDQDGAV